MKTQFFARASAAALGTAMCVTASPAIAQNEPMASGQNEDSIIVVTGSFIRGTPEDAALPVDVFSSDDLDRNGISSPLEFIKDLPSVGSVLGDTNQFSTASQGFQGAGSINLRGLGPTRTLVLMNGRRTISSPGDGFVDTNLIPLFALDRIEILKDGAAATYGSDAIGGVANFVTRQNWEGVEVAGDYEFIDGSNDDYNVSAVIGRTWGDANFLIGAGYQHRSELSTQERDFTQVPYEINPSGWSTLGNPGTYLAKLGPIAQGPAGTTIGLGFDGAVPGTCEATNGISGTTGPGGTGVPVCRFTYVPFDNLVEHQNRYQIFAQMDVDLSDNLAFHAEGLWAHTYQRGRYSPAFPPTQGPRGSGSVGAFYVPDTNPGYAGFIAQSGLAGGIADPANPGSFANLFGSYAQILLFRPLANGGNPITGGRGGQIGEADIEAWRASGGLDWDLADNFRVSFYNTFIRSDRNAYVTDVVGQRLQNALEGFGGPGCDRASGTAGQGPCMYFNPFSNSFPGNPATGQSNPGFIAGNENDPTLVDWLLVPSGTDQREEQWIVDLIFSGESGIDLGGGPVAYAFGAQYRQSDYRSVPLNNVTNLNNNPCFIENDQSCVGTPIEGVGPFIFLGGFRNVQLEQDVHALFAEVNVPIGDTIELTGAIRYEDYGGSVGSTINPKGSIRWEPTDWLVLRGSVGTTFRGPLPTQVSPNAVTSLAGIQAAANNFKSVDIFGNPVDLGPETAFTYNVGAIVDYAGFAASIDYWSYDFDDRITTTPGQAIASTVASAGVSPNGTQFANCASPLVDLITFAGGGCVQGTTTGLDISRVRTDWVNGPSVKTSGFDFALDYTTELGPGLFSIGGQATHILDYDIDDFVFRGVLLQTGYSADGFSNFFRDPGTVSKWRANGYVNYNVSGLNLRYTIQHIAGVTDDRCINVNPCASTPEFGGTNFAAEIPSYTQHDFHVAYDLPFQFMDTQLQFSIENFTNEDPAPARLELGYNPFIGNPLGRVYRLGARVRF
ncbi:MAG: TonB-dependent receptor domain-containing protein [Parasphingopyxis sp.]|nr:TonB-dependent receptor [Sphingomonadales bacterium]